MKNIRKTLTCRISALLLALVLILSSLVSCISLGVESKSNIQSSISASLSYDDKNYDYVCLYLDDWGISNFDIFKFSYFENAVYKYYNYEFSPESILDHARKTAIHFLDNYYDNLNLKDKTAVTDALLYSYASTLGDPYCVYREPESYENYNSDMSGTFGGIGVNIEYSYQDNTLYVTGTIIDSPAERAGIQAGDYIVKVDNKGIDELGYPDIVYAVRGEIGTEVTITVMRGEEVIDFTITREKVVDKTVDYEIDENRYGYIRISDFKANTYEQFVEAVKYIEENNAVGVIFDLRSNPGGYLSTVCDMISYLVPNGNTIVSYQYKNSEMTSILSSDDLDPATEEKSDHTLTIPTVVICDGYTASAGEIFTAAIRDYRDDGLLTATIVGTTTFKKGITQNTFIYPSDNSSLTMTIAYYNPPSGVNYHGIGITPDVLVELPSDATEDLQYNQAIAELEKLINENNN